MSEPEGCRPFSSLHFGSYVHGLHGPVAIVPARVAAWLMRVADLDRLLVEVRAGGYSCRR